MNLSTLLKELGLSPLNTLVGSAHNLYKMPFDTVNEYKGSIIADNFHYHYENNEFYSDLCKKKDVRPEDVKGFDDIKKITFNPEKAVEVLQSCDGKHTRHIVGPPFLVYRLIKYCMDRNIKLNLEKNSFIITLGGWKRFTGEEIPRAEFNELCHEYLGVQSYNVRDMYGLVEANMLAVECHKQEKHIPPWVHVSMRNPHNVLEEV